MYVVKSDPNLSKEALYREIRTQLTGLFSEERSGLANAANMCALLYQLLPDLNWAGFYFMQGQELVLGPFQGKVALRADRARPWGLRHGSRTPGDSAGARRA